MKTLFASKGKLFLFLVLTTTVLFLIFLASLVTQASPILLPLLKTEQQPTKQTTNSSFTTQHSGSAAFSKVQVFYKGESYQEYLLTPGTGQVVVPYFKGNQEYRIRYSVVVDQQSNIYRLIDEYWVKVEMENPLTPFLIPSQRVPFQYSTNTARQAAQLAKETNSPQQLTAAVYDYVSSTITYDFDQAATAISYYCPEADTILARKTGICTDYVVLMAAMLRLEGIPTRVVTGTVPDNATPGRSYYHAWVEVYLPGAPLVPHGMQGSDPGWQLLDPTYGSLSAYRDLKSHPMKLYSHYTPMTYN